MVQSTPLRGATDHERSADMKFKPKYLIVFGLLLSFVSALLNPMGRQLVFLKDAQGNYVFDDAGHKIFNGVALSTEQIIYRDLVYIGLVIALLGLLIHVLAFISDIRDRRSRTITSTQGATAPK